MAERNTTTSVSYSVLESQISMLGDLRWHSNSDIRAKYNEVKAVFVNSDSKAAEGFYNCADKLYSVNSILDTMINQSIQTFKYAKELFSNTDADISQQMEEEEN